MFFLFEIHRHLNALGVGVSDVLPERGEEVAAVGLQVPPAAEAVQHHLEAHLGQLVNELREVRKIATKTASYFWAAFTFLNAVELASMVWK